MVKSNLSLFLCLFIDVSMNAQICTNELPPSFNYPQHERLEQSVTSSINLTPLSVLRVGYIYKPLTIFRIKADGIFERAIGQSLSCNINVNCSEGQNWQNQKRAVALITDIFNGTLCTGALINNTKNDGRQLFLTADHCLPDGYDSWGGGKTDLNFWLFYWNYESPSCSNVTDVPMPSAQGAKILSNFSFTDYALLEITDNLNYVQGYRPYFCGWGGKLFIRGGSVCIHHPKGDIKKIAISTEAIIDTNHDPLNWVGGDTSPILTHYVVNFTKGTAEPGSSGAPLFNMEGNIMGQLHGGNTSCPPITKYFGSLPVGMKNSSGPKLINFLDPINGNAEQCAGLSR